MVDASGVGDGGLADAAGDGGLDGDARQYAAGTVFDGAFDSSRAFLALRPESPTGRIRIIARIDAGLRIGPPLSDKQSI